MAAFSLCAGLLTAVVPAGPAWGGVGHHLRHQQRQAQHQAHRLDAQARHQAALVAAARRRLARLDARANAALADLQRARLAADKAQAADAAAQAKLKAAQARTAAARATLNEMAADAYRTVASGGTLGTTLALVQTGNPQAFVDGIQVLGQVGKSEAAVVDELRVAEADELRAGHIADAAAAAATASERTASVVKQRADDLVSQQNREIQRTRQLLARTQHAASKAHATARQLAHRIALAEARAAAIRAAQAYAAAHSDGPIPLCNGGSVTGAANGRLPVAALCPLWGAPGAMLRADAAAAFNQMSKAYAAAFGTPLCVTASYRTYDKQVELYATMPKGYAAVPGTSNHGWGLAVDLCGGIQVDGSPQHQWLLDHAAAFDWFHPAWAMPGGPGPHEPWHWEYAG